MLRRTDTPERCDTCVLDRAALVMATTIRVMNEGTVTARPAMSDRLASPAAVSGPAPAAAAPRADPR